MQSYNIDVPVALVFFNRPEPLKKVFEAVRSARPSKLFLIQDGARLSNPVDSININACRGIVSNIDWECEVMTNYSSDNLGCGMRIFSGISWAFEYVDRLVIIEDDIVVNNSFFEFCFDLLERYKDDDRIQMISGMNHLGTYSPIAGDSYFFSTTGSIWGWATWKRAWNDVDYNCIDLKDISKRELLYSSIRNKDIRREVKSMTSTVLAKLEKGEKLSAWSFQHGIAQLSQNRLNIVPSKNLISNIGLTEDSTHAVSKLHMLPRGIRKVFYMSTHKILLPLQNPKFIVEDVYYTLSVKKIMGTGFAKQLRRIEGQVYKILPWLGKL
ncbi:MAG: hemolysin activation protein [Tannerellaceae bacterium]